MYTPKKENPPLTAFLSTGLYHVWCVGLLQLGSMPCYLFHHILDIKQALILPLTAYQSHCLTGGKSSEPPLITDHVKKSKNVEKKLIYGVFRSQIKITNVEKHAGAQLCQALIRLSKLVDSSQLASYQLWASQIILGLLIILHYAYIFSQLQLRKELREVQQQAKGNKFLQVIASFRLDNIGKYQTKSVSV